MPGILRYCQKMNSTRSRASLPLVLTLTLLSGACVDLTPPGIGRKDAGNEAGNAAGGAGGSTTFTARLDAAASASGGGVSAGGAATGGTVTGGTSTGGTASAADAGPGVDGSGISETGQDGMASSGGALATDARDATDAPWPQDVGLDVPFSVDAPLALDSAARDAGQPEAGSWDGARTEGGDSSGADTVETGGATGALIISIDFVGGRPTGATGTFGTTVMGASESAGVIPATHWNSAPGAEGTIPALVSAGGDVTNVAVSWIVTSVDSAPDVWSVGSTDVPGDDRMMNGYLDPRATSAPATINVTGLPAPPSSGCDVYVYSYSDVLSGATRQSEYSIGSTTYSVAQTGPPPSAFAKYVLASSADGGAGSPGNYVVFRSVSGPSFTLIARPRPSGAALDRAPVNGIQIVCPAGS